MCRHLLFLYFHFSCLCFFLFFFNDTATTEIYTLSLHDALPICLVKSPKHSRFHLSPFLGIDRELPIWRLNSASFRRGPPQTDRKSTRLNSSHLVISYAVFCLKKKKNTYYDQSLQHTVVHIHTDR